MQQMPQTQQTQQMQQMQQMPQMQQHAALEQRAIRHLQLPAATCGPLATTCLGGLVAQLGDQRIERLLFEKCLELRLVIF